METTKLKERDERDANRDAITGEVGSHPIGTGLGAVAGGMAAGAAAGTVVGPVGTVIGAAVGAVVGGLAGKAVGELVDPTLEDNYWREHYTHEPYSDHGLSYDDYGPAYRTGYEGRGRYPGRSFDDVQNDLQANYERTRGNSRLDWYQGKSAVRAAWDRVERALPGDSDRDGK